MTLSRFQQVISAAWASPWATGGVRFLGSFTPDDELVARREAADAVATIKTCFVHASASGSPGAASSKRAVLWANMPRPPAPRHRRGAIPIVPEPKGSARNLPPVQQFRIRHDGHLRCGSPPCCKGNNFHSARPWIPKPARLNFFDEGFRSARL